jgi:hypothetical protein
VNEIGANDHRSQLIGLVTLIRLLAVMGSNRAPPRRPNRGKSVHHQQWASLRARARDV